MAGAWNGDLHQVLVDDVSRSTYGNVRAAAAAARKLGVSEVVLVTSGWHSRRASVCSRRHTAIGFRSRQRASVERGLRELVCWLVVPVQVALARRSR